MRILLRVLMAFAWLLIIVFGAAILFGGDTTTRLTGAALTAIGVGLALAARAGLRRTAPAPPPAPPPRPPDDIEKETLILGRGRLSRGATLRLNATGLELHHRKKTITFAWNDVSEFKVVYLGSGQPGVRGTPLVGYSLRETPLRPRKRSEKFTHFMMGTDQTLPGIWERPPSELCPLLERYRQRYSTTAF